MSNAPQRPPQPDNRYRVHRSVKCYLADLECGSKSCTWYFFDSVERVVYRSADGSEVVQYDNAFLPLRSARDMETMVQRLLGEGASIHIGGRSISALAPTQEFRPFPFIEIYSRSDVQKYRDFQAPQLP